MKPVKCLFILLCLLAALALSSCQMVVKPEDETLFDAPMAAPETTAASPAESVPNDVAIIHDDVIQTHSQEQPVQPEQPEQPNQPVLPIQPELPEHPEQPNQPVLPIQPELPEQPEQPNQPVLPIQPEQPSLPGGSDEPGLNG